MPQCYTIETMTRYIAQQLQTLVEIKTLISHLVRMKRLWNNLHKLRLNKPNNLSFFWSTKAKVSKQDSQIAECLIS